jgi:hypothetical protein
MGMKHAHSPPLRALRNLIKKSGRENCYIADDPYYDGNLVIIHFTYGEQVIFSMAAGSAMTNSYKG